jgi:hypothetical protein
LTSEQTYSRAYGRSSTTLGDYDNDGDFDLAINGTPGVGRCVVGIGGDVGYIDEMLMSAPRIYRNDSNNFFTDIQVDIPRCRTADSYHDFCIFGGCAGYSISFGDYNNDQKLDILRSGNGGYGISSAIYKNMMSVQNFASVKKQLLL